MNYPAARNGVSIGIFIIAPRGGELNLYPPQEGLSASGGFKKSEAHKLRKHHLMAGSSFTAVQQESGDAKGRISLNHDGDLSVPVFFPYRV
jgi:hypothetical protein